MARAARFRGFARGVVRSAAGDCRGSRSVAAAAAEGVLSGLHGLGGDEAIVLLRTEAEGRKRLPSGSKGFCIGGWSGSWLVPGGG